MVIIVFGLVELKPCRMGGWGPVRQDAGIAPAEPRRPLPYCDVDWTQSTGQPDPKIFGPAMTSMTLARIDLVSCCKCLLILLIKRRNRRSHFSVFLPCLDIALHRKGVNLHRSISAINSHLQRDINRRCAFPFLPTSIWPVCPVWFLSHLLNLPSVYIQLVPYLDPLNTVFCTFPNNL